jgi:hypothetical protein
MHYRVSLLIVCISFAMVTVAWTAGENMGAEDMSLYGGNRGKVPFSHLSHQNRLGDCDKCHALFPQNQGSIEELKSKGQLKKKQVMNKLCIKCHKAEKLAGNKSGPTTCSKCHIR